MSGRSIRRTLLTMFAASACALGGVTLPAQAHPEECGDGHTDHSHSEICFTEEQIAGFDDSGADLQPGEIGRTRNMHLLANLPKSGVMAGETAFNSDIAFWGNHAIQGNYNGFQITDISQPEAPRIVSQVNCPGSQNDVSVWKNLIFTSTDSSRAFAECSRDGVANFPQTATNPSSWEGIRVFDWSDPANPRLVATVETDCGSHTHTLIPDEAAGRALLYVQSYSPNASFPDCQPPHDKISIVSVPLAAPQLAAVIAEPVLFPDGGFPGAPGRSATTGCHDITVYPAIGLAAGACTGQGVIMDISNPVSPVVLATITDPNFAFWHSATFTNDGSKVLFTDELGGGSGPTCNPTIGPVRGADAIYDISNPAAPVFLSYFKISRTQSNRENCVAHNGVMLPTAERDLFVQAWYQGGISVIDLTDPTNPKEIGFFDRGPLSDERSILGGSWSAYWYNGKIYSNDIQLGLDVIGFSASDKASAAGVKLGYLNAQTQEPVGR